MRGKSSASGATASGASIQLGQRLPEMALRKIRHDARAPAERIIQQIRLNADNEQQPLIVSYDESTANPTAKHHEVSSQHGSPYQQHQNTGPRHPPHSGATNN